MATLQLSEVLIDATLAKLRTGLATRIATINGEFTDFTLGTPERDDFYAFGSHLISRVPAVVVTQGDGGDFLEEGSHSLTLNDSLAVAVLDQDPDRSILGRKLLRLARAVTEVVYDDDPKEKLNDPYGGSTFAAYSVKPERTIPGRAFEQRDDEGTVVGFRSMYVVLFRAWRVEEA